MTKIKKLGDLLKEAGLIDDFQLQAALSQQRNWGGKLGKILIEEEFVREEDMARVISEKLGIPHADLFEPAIPEDVVMLIKPDIAKKYQVMPAKKEARTLFLAMSDPLDIEAIDAIRFITELNVKPLLAMASEIRDAIGHYYDKEDLARRNGSKPFARRGVTSGGKMELIRGSNLNMPASEETDASSPILSEKDNLLQLLKDTSIKLDALISLLIESGVITRDKLISMLYQKKIGL
jgi:hypothetical protein